MHHSVGIGKQKHIPSNLNNISTNIPAIAVKISSPIESTIVSLYLPPSLCPSIVAQEMETVLPQSPSPAIILGNFNAQHSSWGNPGSNTRGHMLQDYFDTCSIEVIHNTTATRTCPTNGQGTILDFYTLSSSIASSFSVSIHKDTYGSDHHPLFVHSLQLTYCPQKRPRWKYEEADWEKYKIENP